MQSPKTFRPWQPGQTSLLPSSPREWLSEDHQVYFLLDLVDVLDLSAIVIPAQSKDPRGEKGFDPRMMTLLLLYAYCTGVVSSRRIEPVTRIWPFGYSRATSSRTTAASVSSAAATLKL
jgi:transposase